MIASRLPRTFALRTLLLAVLVCAVLCAAYKNRRRYADLGLVTAGMNCEDVLEAIGEPDRVAAQSRSASWVYYRDSERRDGQALVVRFDDGKVIESYCAMSLGPFLFER